MFESDEQNAGDGMLKLGDLGFKLGNGVHRLRQAAVDERIQLVVVSMPVPVAVPVSMVVMSIVLRHMDVFDGLGVPLAIFPQQPRG